MRLVWTNAAVIDLEQISDYLFEMNPELATPTIQRIFESTSELNYFPDGAAWVAKKARGSWF